MAIAGLWRPADRRNDEGGGAGDSNQPPSFAMLTTVPGPDVAAIHGRPIVVLRPQDWGRWLNPTRPESELRKPLLEGSLMVEQVRPGSG
jgi:putative SOS response-associated peptidase YedK